MALETNLDMFTFDGAWNVSGTAQKREKSHQFRLLLCSTFHSVLPFPPSYKVKQEVETEQETGQHREKNLSSNGLVIFYFFVFYSF